MTGWRDVLLEAAHGEDDWTRGPPPHIEGAHSEDPFAPAFELWRHGVTLYFAGDDDWKVGDDGVVRVQVPIQPAP